MHAYAQKRMILQVHHIAVAAASGALFLFVPFISAFFISLFLVWLVFRFDSRIIAGVAIAFLIYIPIMLSLGQDARAEQIAVYAYFLLAITVALQIVEFKRRPHLQPKSASIQNVRHSVSHSASRPRRRATDISLSKDSTKKQKPAPRKPTPKTRAVDAIKPQK